MELAECIANRAGVEINLENFEDESHQQRQIGRCDLLSATGMCNSVVPAAMDLLLEISMMRTGDVSSVPRKVTGLEGREGRVPDETGGHHFDQGRQQRLKPILGESPGSTGPTGDRRMDRGDDVTERSDKIKAGGSGQEKPLKRDADSGDATQEATASLTEPASKKRLHNRRTGGCNDPTCPFHAGFQIGDRGGTTPWSAGWVFLIQADVLDSLVDNDFDAVRVENIALRMRLNADALARARSISAICTADNHYFHSAPRAEH